MGNAVWLFLATPAWYFSTVLAPFSAGPLTAIPALGVLSLALGVTLGALKRERGLLVFALLPLASQALVAVAGFMRGMLRESTPLIWAFLLLQVAVAAYLVWRVKRARLAAVALAVFAASYAFHAGFIASMAFTDTWL